MRNLVFSLTLFLTFITYSQQESYHEDAMRYLTLNGTEQQYSYAIDQMYTMLQQQYSSQEVPSGVWQELQKDKSAPIEHIKSLLVSAYRGNFTHDDIKELIKFYESDAGKQFVKDRTKLSSEQQLVLSDFFNSEIGQKVQHQSESLKSMVSEVSELWSRDLYKQTTEKLQAKGYQLPQ